MVICTLLFALPLGANFVLAQDESGDINYSLTTTLTYVNPPEGTKVWNLTEEDRTSGLFMDNAWQSVQLKEASFPLESVEKDEDGNSIAILEFPKQQLLPGENLSYTIEYSIVSKPRTIPDISEDESGTLNEIPQDLKENYTSNEGPWMINEPALLELAHDIGRNETNVLKLVKDSVAWIRDNIHYSAHELPFYPNETLNALEGDCDDQAILLIALSRIMGIPSYLQVGPIYLPTNELVQEDQWENHVQVVQKRIGWHGWAMLYIPPWAWLPADLTFVTSDFKDPLDAIRYGAVVSQNTIQYMNFSKTDYVAPSRQARTLLLENDFFVMLEDEMTELEQSDVGVRLDPATAAGFVLVCVMILVSSFLIARRWRSRPEKEEFPAESESTRRAQTKH